MAVPDLKRFTVKCTVETQSKEVHCAVCDHRPWATNNPGGVGVKRGGKESCLEENTHDLISKR